MLVFHATSEVRSLSKHAISWYGMLASAWRSKVQSLCGLVAMELSLNQCSPVSVALFHLIVCVCVQEDQARARMRPALQRQHTR